MNKKFAILLAGIVAMQPLTAFASTGNVSDWAKTTVQTYLGKEFQENANYRYSANREFFADLTARMLKNMGYNLQMPDFNPFNDTENSSVIALSHAGLLAGVGNSKFDPRGSMTREQLAVINDRIYKELGIELEPIKEFKVSDAYNISSWALPSVRRVYQAGLMVGNGDTFAPKSVLTKEEAIIITSRNEVTLAELVKLKQTQIDEQVKENEKYLANDVFEYDVATKRMIVKKSATVDVDEPGTPKDISSIHVVPGATLKLIGIKATDVVVSTDGKLELVNSAVTNLRLDKAALISDKSSTVSKVTTTRTCYINGNDTQIGEVTISEGVPSEVVNVSAIVKSLVIDAGTTVILSNFVDKALITKAGSHLRVFGDINTLTVNNSANVEIARGSIVHEIVLNAKTVLDTETGTRLKKVTVNRDGFGSEIVLKAETTIDLKVDGRATINGVTYTSDDKIEYTDGKVVSTGKDSTDTPSKGDEDAVNTAMLQLTADVLLGNNKNNSEVTENLTLPQKFLGCDMKYSSSNTVVITDSGIVTRLANSTDVMVTATIKSGKHERTKTLRFTVPGNGESSEVEDTESLRREIGYELSLIVIPSIVSGQFTLPLTTTKGYEIEYTTNPSGLMSFTKTSLGWDVSVETPDEDLPLTLTATVIHENLVVPRKANLIIKGRDILEEMSSAFESLDLPSVIYKGMGIPTHAGRYPLTVTSSNTDVLMVERSELIPGLMAEDYKVNLTYTMSHGKHTLTETREVTVTRDQKTYAQHDMKGILSGVVISKPLSDKVELPSKYKDYILEVTIGDSRLIPEDEYDMPYTGKGSRHLGVSESGGKITIENINPLSSQSWEIDIHLKLTTEIGGTNLEETRLLSTVVRPKYTDATWESAMRDELIKLVTTIELPAVLKGKSEGMKKSNTFIFEGTDIVYHINLTTVGGDLTVQEDNGMLYLIPLSVTEPKDVTVVLRTSIELGRDIIYADKAFSVKLLPN